MPVMRNAIGVLLAGGQGERLWPLTRDRAKPAVPFGGVYRIIDLTLSNCLNSDLRRVFVLTQYKALSLNRHVRRGWSSLMGHGDFIEVLPPQMRVSQHWYQGTADAVYQNIYSIGSEQSNYVFILSGDHIYKMNYQKMLEQHVGVGRGCHRRDDRNGSGRRGRKIRRPRNRRALAHHRIRGKAVESEAFARSCRQSATPRWASISSIRSFLSPF